MKITIITVVFNNIKTIKGAIESVYSQGQDSLEHIIIDGGSTDGTKSYLESIRLPYIKYISEPDLGIYDAINKGILNSTGKIIGILHSDDFFSDANVINDVLRKFNNNVDILYGDLDYVSKNNSNSVIRRWKSGVFNRSNLKYGWMPPHPAVFIRRSIYNKHGLYDISYSISADYDFLLRVFTEEKLSVVYMPRVLVKMRLGGKSNNSITSIFYKSLEDYRAVKKNNIGGLLSVILKNMRKVNQFFI